MNKTHGLSIFEKRQPLQEIFNKYITGNTYLYMLSAEAASERHLCRPASEIPSEDASNV